MTHKYRVCTFKFITALVTCISAAALAGTSIYLSNWVMGIILAAICLLFAVIAVLNGSTLSIDSCGLTRSFFGVKMSETSWSEIEEIGVVGTKVFNNNDPKHTGTRYIYLSPKKLDEAARFKLAMEWPPFNMLYMLYSKDRLDALQMHFGKKIEAYNAGDIFF